MLILVLILILLFLAVLVFNTLRFSNKTAVVAAAELDEVDTPEAARRLSAALQLKTISGHDLSKLDPEPFLALHRLLETAYPKVHQTLGKEVINDYSLLYKWPGQNPELAPIAFLAHQDVVPVEPGTEKDWTYAPFGGDIADGFIWGRGALDMKNTLMALMESVEILVTRGFRPNRTIYLAFGHDEEIGGSQGAGQIAAHLGKQGVRLDFTLDEGLVVLDEAMSPTGSRLGVVGIAEKGYLTLKLEVAGPGGHASTPPATTNIGRLCRAVARLENNQMPATLAGPSAAFFGHIGPDMPFGKKLLFANQWLFKPLLLKALGKLNTTNAMIRTTTAPTMIQGGVKENVLPGKAHLLVNFRILPGDSVAKVVAHVKQVIADGDITVEVLKKQVSEPPPVSSPETGAFDSIRKTILQVFPDTAVAPGLMLATTDSRQYTQVSDNCYRFAPFVFSPEDITRVHGTNERVSIDGYSRAIQYYAQLMRNSC